MQIYETLKNDHNTVKDLLNELLQLDDDSDEKERNRLVKEIRDELIPHARAEESVLYNCLRDFDEGRTVIKEAFKEHAQAETYLRTLQMKDATIGNWRKTAEKLQKALEHHIEEEETRIFEVARRLISESEAEELNRAFEQLKPEVREEGFLKNTIDMVANMMPRRFVETFKHGSP